MVKLSMTELTTDVRTWLSKPSSELVKQPLRCRKPYCSGTKNPDTGPGFLYGYAAFRCSITDTSGHGIQLSEISAAFVRLILTLI